MRIPAIGLATAVLTLANVCLADIAPPPNYVESCTLARQQSAGQECQECGTYYAEHDKCGKTLGPQGFARRCRSRGASVWTEVWCRSAGTASPQPDPDPHPSDPNYAKAPPEPVALATDPAQPVAADPASHPVAADPAPQPSPVPPRSGCGSCSVGHRAFSVGALVAMVLGGVLVVVRRGMRTKDLA